MTDKPSLSPATNTTQARKPSRWRWSVLLVPLLILGSLLWVRNWFDQRSRLFQGCRDVILGDPLLRWGKLLGENTAREVFGVPVDLHVSQERLTPYQVRLIGSYIPLKSLHLRGATDADVLRLSGLVNLERLTLDDSAVTDDACQVIGTFVNLRHLSIRGGVNSTPHISDQGVAALTGLNQLMKLHLQSPDLTDGALKHIGTMSSLRQLALMDAQIRGVSLDQLSLIPSLFELQLENCPLEVENLRQLSDCRTLRTLSLNRSTVTDEMLPALIPVRSLGNISLIQTKVTPEGCRSVLRHFDYIVDASGERILRRRNLKSE